MTALNCEHIAKSIPPSLQTDPVLKEDGNVVAQGQSEISKAIEKRNEAARQEKQEIEKVSVKV